MLSKIISSATLGVEAYTVEVESDIQQQLPSFVTVGLPDGAVKESKERVTSAIKNSDFVFPSKRVTINLAPADIRKEGSAFDLPIAVGILSATGQILRDRCDDFVMLGELSLDGTLRSIPGILPMVMSFKNNNCLKGIIVPKANAKEAAMAGTLPVFPVNINKTDHRAVSIAVQHLGDLPVVLPVISGVGIFGKDYRIIAPNFTVSADQRGQLLEIPD